MEQKFDGTPRAEIRVDGRKLTRTVVENDWGTQLIWSIRRDGKVVATVPARADASYEHAEKTPGKYEVVLQMFHYVDYKKTPAGEFTASKFVDVSNKIEFTV